MSCPDETVLPVTVRCAHKVGRSLETGDGVREVDPIRAILEDIRDHSRLLALRYPIVYGYRIDLVPTVCRDWVLVVFEVETRLARTMRYACNDWTGHCFEYYEIPTAKGGYRAVDVLGFLNAPDFRPYRGPIRFRDGFEA